MENFEVLKNLRGAWGWSTRCYPELTARARTLPNRVIFVPLTANTALRAETSYISLVQSIHQLKQFSKDALHHVTWENKWWRCKAKNRCQVICSSNPWTQQQPGGCLHLRKRRQCSAPARPDLLSRICTPPFIWRSLYILQIYSLNSATLLNRTGATQWMSTLASGHNTSSVRSNWATFMFPHDTASQTSMIRVSATLGFNVLDAPKHPTRKTKFRVSATLARLHGCSAAFGSSQKRFIPTLSPST